MVLSRRRKDLGWISGEDLYRGSGEAAQKGCECPVLGGVQDQVGRGPGQPGLVLDMEVGGPACGGRVGIS